MLYISEGYQEFIIRMNINIHERVIRVIKGGHQG